MSAMNNHDLLISKIESEFNRHYDSIISEDTDAKKISKAKFIGLMEDLIAAITFADLGDNAIEELLRKENLLKELSEFWNERHDYIIDLNQRILNEYIQQLLILKTMKLHVEGKVDNEHF